MILMMILIDLMSGGVLVLSWWIAGRAARRRKPDHTDNRRSALSVLRIVICALLFIIGLTPLSLVNNRLLQAPFQTLRYGATTSAANAQLEQQFGCTDPAGVGLTLTIRSINFADATANADMTLCVGDQVLRDLQTVTGAKPLSHGLASKNVSKVFLDSSFEVSYEGSLPAVTWSRGITIDSILNQTDPSGEIRGPVSLGTIQLSLLGNADDYPFDSYSAVGDWFIFVPRQLVVVTARSSQVIYIVHPLIATEPETGNLVWQSGYAGGVGDVVQAIRSSSALTFIWLITVLPMLLFAGLLTLITASADTAERRRFPPELLMGVGAFLLAVIPIRSVLVPADIPTLTVIDYVLGAEMAIIVTGSLMIIFADSIRSQSMRAEMTQKESTEADTQEAKAPVLKKSSNLAESGQGPDTGNTVGTGWPG